MEEPVVIKNINTVIVNSLKGLGYKVYFLQKPDGVAGDDYVTFNYTENSDWYSNDKPEVDTYFVTLNIVTPRPEKVFEMDSVIRQQLKETEGFTGISNQGSIYDKELRTFYTVITFETII